MLTTMPRLARINFSFLCYLLLAAGFVLVSIQTPQRVTAQEHTFARSTEQLATGESVELVEFKKPFIFAMQYSPSGAELGVIFRLGPNIIVDAKSWAIERKLPGLRQIAFSPDGHTLATAEGRDGVRLWNQKSPATSTNFLVPRPSEVIGDVEFSRSGAWVATAHEGGTISIWDANSALKLKELQGHSGAVLCVAFSRDDKLLYSGGADSTIRVWETETWQSVKVVNGPKANAVIALCVSFDGSAIASVNGKMGAMIWDTQTWKASIQSGYTAVAAANKTKLFALGGKDVLLTEGSRSSERHLKIGDAAKPINITAVSFTPDDQKLATGNLLGELRVVSLN